MNLRGRIRNRLAFLLPLLPRLGYSLTISVDKMEGMIEEQITVSGYLRRRNTGIADARVTLHSNEVEVGSTFTESNGEYTIPVNFFQEGSYSLYTIADIEFI